MWTCLYIAEDVSLSHDYYTNQRNSCDWQIQKPFG